MRSTTVALTSGGNDSSIATGTVEISSSAGQVITANADTTAFGAAVSTSSFSSVATLDISSALGAQSAIKTLDAALAQISSSRGDLGASQNRCSTAANMTRGQILQQAGTAILAQANSLPNNVLSLLR